MTAQQQLASDPQFSVWVAASAGTGKTKVLTDRVLRLLLEGVPPGKILCLTYTKAAAAEMANRIQHELGQWVLMEKDALLQLITSLTKQPATHEMYVRARQLLAMVLDTPEGLKVQTLHSFCGALMKRFPLEAGVVPHSRQIEESEARELLFETANLLVRQHQPNDAPLKTVIARIIANVYEGKFHDLVEQLASQRDKIEALLARTGLEEACKRVYQRFDIHETYSPEDALAEYEQKTDHQLLKCIAEGMLKSSTRDQKAAVQLVEWLHAKEADKLRRFKLYRGFFYTTDDKTLRKDFITKGAIDKAYVPADAKEILQRECKLVVTLKNRINSITIARSTCDLLIFAVELLQAYEQKKAQRAVLDYQDLILMTKKLLRCSDVSPWVLYKLDGGIDHLLLDEAQDTSPEQWEIIEALSEEFFSGETAVSHNRTIFVVGDEKQSIFSFQGADPNVFSHMHAHFAEKIQQAAKGWHSVALDRSFRSGEAILNIVDTVFSDPSLQQSVTFHLEPIKHHLHRTGDASRIELWPLIRPSLQEEREPWQLPVVTKETQDPAASSAKHIAQTIARWLEERRLLPAKGRPVEPKDILILVRRRNEFTQFLVKYLKEYHIPVAGSDRMVLMEHLAVMDLVALGQFLLLPHDDLILATLLKTPLLGLSEELLFELAYDRTQSLWDTLYTKQNDHTEFGRVYAYLVDLLNKVDQIPPFELFSYVLEAGGGRKKMIQRLGYQINDPINEFLNLALDYEIQNIASMQGFLKWISTGRIDIKRDMEQGQNQVRIMTVHGSKGLQAPIVFLPDTTSLPNSRGFDLLWGADHVGDVQLIWLPRASMANDHCHQLKRAYQKRDYDEYIRLLYVALTRAEDELYVSGYLTSSRNSGDQVKEKPTWYACVEQAMSTIGHKREDGTYDYETAQTRFITSLAKQEEVLKIDECAMKFVEEKWIKEEPKLVPLRPSSEQNVVPVDINQRQVNAIVRGKMIHRLLQYLPLVNVDSRKETAVYYVDRYADSFTREQLDQMVSQVLAILEDPRFGAIFSADSRAEVPIVGVEGKYMISARVDRLVVTDDSVIILDYKTSKVIPLTVGEVNKDYIKQMVIYKKLLQKIYPDKRIECILLWTNGPHVMDITHATMADQML